MHATHWIIGCTLCIATASVAATTNAETQGMDNSGTTVDAGNAHDSGNIDGGDLGDLLGLIHDGNQHIDHNDAAAGDPGHTEHTDSTHHASAPAHQPHLGWQSLLPGSIQ